MRAHYIQHVSFEDLGNIKPWLEARGMEVTSTRIFEEEPLPDIEEVDILIIMGGPMGAGDDRIYPWLIKEKLFIEKAIKKGKKVLGICLGAQLMAHVLGAKVFKNRYREIGWFPVELQNITGNPATFSDMPRIFTPFHWHGDTFDIPAGAVRTARSIGCDNQAFIYRENAIGLQFHLESNREGIERLIKNCPDDITEGRFIQESGVMMEGVQKKIDEVRTVLDLFLNKFFSYFSA